MPAFETLEDAVKKADSFIDKYYAFRRLRKAKKRDGAWLVEFNIGVVKPEIVTIKIDEKTGKVVDYIAPDNG
ncbi:MAG: hypothetical protein FJ320_08300 [SAR202 cluster bacterium]|nr:hypothetical protein [SAR202 cluster bacterium]